jgi:hypothetical protein
MARIFSSADCEYALSPVTPNGWCIFTCVALALRLNLVEVVDRMKKFAPKYFRRKDAPFVVEDRQTCLTLWKQLDVKAKSTINAFWTSEAADLLIPMMAECLDVKICTWYIEEGELVKSPLEYPGRDESVNLFKSNVFVEHYDLMAKK